MTATGSMLGVVLLAAGCAYQPGSFDYSVHRFPGQRVTVGCFDVAIERRADLPAGPVLGFDVANRCDHPQQLDFAALTVVGRDATGHDVALAPYDPRHELQPLALDGRTCGKEALAYPAAQPLAQICVDVAPLAHLTSTPAAPTWRCFTGVGAIAPTSPAAPLGVYPEAMIVGKTP